MDVVMGVVEKITDKLKRGALPRWGAGGDVDEAGHELRKARG